MLWTLWDILIPLLITFALGLCLGWLLWRWRRRRVSAADLALQDINTLPQTDDDALAEQLRSSTDQLAQVKRELEIERSSNQFLKNKVDDMRQQELPDASADTELGVVVDTSKVEMEVGLVQAEKDRELLRVKLDECQRKGQAMNDEIASLETRVQENEARNQQLSGDLESALSTRSKAETELESALSARSKAETELESAQAARTKAEAELENASTVKANSGDGAAQQTADAAARITELERQLEQAQQALGQNDSTVLRTRLDEAETELRARGAALDSAEQQLEQASQQMEQAGAVSQGPATASSDHSGSADQAEDLEAIRATVVQKDARIAELEQSLAALADENHEPIEPGGATADSKLAGWGTATDQSQVSARYNADRRTSGTPVSESDAGNSANDAQSHARGTKDDSAQPTNSESKSSIGDSSTAYSSDARATNDSISLDSSAQINAESLRPTSVDQPASSAGAGETAVTAGRSEDGVNKNTTGGATSSGYVPTGWQVPTSIPDKKERDKLTDIKGVGPKLEGVLHANGIYFFRQIAQLDAAGLDELQEQMPEFRGRIQRDNWQGQSVDLHREKYGEAP